MQKLFAGTLAFSSMPSIRASVFEGLLFNPCGFNIPSNLASHPIVSASWEGIEFSRFWDAHAHIAGTGDANSGIFTTPEMRSLWHPIQYLQHELYLNAGCTDNNNIDQSYIERLAFLVKEINQVYSANISPAVDNVVASDSDLAGAKILLFAFDQAHDESGVALPEKTAFHVPNGYTLKIAQRYPQYFEWVCSIHPYRRDAVAMLHAAAANGTRAVKWLPSAMGIDPASDKCNAFYQSLSNLNIPLICHAGEEKAVQGMGLQDANNPLKMRRAMDAGVRVVIAHCASLGEDIDLDKGEHGPHVSSFELFTRLMANDHYQHHLFADISAITQRNRSLEVIRTIIEHQEWHGRLLNGSDYPLPGVLPLFEVGKLASAGLLEKEVVPVLKQIQRYNPLLFDFVLKRQLRAGSQKLSDSIFHTRDFFLRSTS